MIRFLILLIILNTPCILHGQKKNGYLVKNATLITCADNEVIPNACIQITGDRIDKIFSLQDIEGIEFDSVIDFSGKYIIPGLIDSHQHLFGRNISDKAIENALRFGITTVRDMGGDCEYLNILRDDIKKGNLYGPDICFSALIGGDEFIKTDRRAISSTPEKYEVGKAPGMRSVNDSTDLDQLMTESVNLGATGIKVYSHISPGLFNKITQKAHEYGLKVWAHGVVPPTGLEEVIRADVNSISHASFFLVPDNWNLKVNGSLAFDSTQIDTVRLTRVFDLMKKHNTYFDPTLFLNLRMANILIKDSVKHQKYTSALLYVMREAYRQGVKIVAGTDIFFDDYNGYVPEIHNEIKVYVENVGMTNYDAIRSATIYGAEVLGLDDKTGSIEQGKVANLVVLNSNPLKNIKSTQDIFMVITNGLVIK